MCVSRRNEPNVRAARSIMLHPFFFFSSRDSYCASNYTHLSRRNNAFNRLVVLFRGLQKAVSVSSREGGGVSRDDRIVRLVRPFVLLFFCGVEH